MVGHLCYSWHFSMLLLHNSVSLAVFLQALVQFKILSQVQECSRLSLLLLLCFLPDSENKSDLQYGVELSVSTNINYGLKLTVD